MAWRGVEGRDVTGRGVAWRGGMVWREEACRVVTKHDEEWSGAITFIHHE